MSGVSYISLLRIAMDAEMRHEKGEINSEEFYDIMNSIIKKSKEIDEINSQNYFKSLIKTLF